MKVKTLIVALLLTSSVLANDSKGGGGGDASEARVNEIRSDILSWIQKGGSEGLQFPAGISLPLYNEKMTELLQPKFVTVTFVDEDDPKEEELQVMVDGKPKTCRGFYSRKTNKPYILCNIGRFKETSPSDQYRLIHHEYAGLAYLEQNEEAASDYFISNQLNDYLKEVKVLKLAVKKIVPVVNTSLKVSILAYSKKAKKRLTKGLKKQGYTVTYPAVADIGINLRRLTLISPCYVPSVFAEGGGEWKTCSKLINRIEVIKYGEILKVYSGGKVLTSKEILNQTNKLLESL